jgi:hypothetical protein
VESKPTFRGFVRAVWTLVSNQAGRELKKMGQVRPELMRAVYSHLSDEEAANRLRDVVRSDPPGARATLTYVTRIRDGSCEYDTDRAYRVLRAAMSDASPEPASPGKAEPFERQRELGWSSLDEAFDQLADAVPELAEVAQTAESEPSASDWIKRVENLIGPRSPHERSTTPLLARSDRRREIAARHQRRQRPRQAPTSRVVVSWSTSGRAITSAALIDEPQSIISRSWPSCG